MTTNFALYSTLAVMVFHGVYGEVATLFNDSCGHCEQMSFLCMLFNFLKHTNYYYYYYYYYYVIFKNWFGIYEVKMCADVFLF
jgi:hypothetical protein